jgi:hypothetical protein
MANMKWKESKVGSACHRIGCVLWCQPLLCKMPTRNR